MSIYQLNEYKKMLTNIEYANNHMIDNLNIYNITRIQSDLDKANWFKSELIEANIKLTKFLQQTI